MDNIIDFIYSNRAYFEDFITRSTVQSNAIEGNTLSYADTYAILFNDNSFDIKSVKPREIYEAINHKYALSYVMDYCRTESSELSEDFIKAIAIQVNKNTNEIDGYRKVDVRIRGAAYIPPKASALPNLMMQYVYNYNSSVHDSPFEKAAQFHIEFERIHPFSDGNGRTGRLLINYEMLKRNLAPVVIPSDERSEYFSLIESRDVPKLAKYLESLSNSELERIEQFKTIDIPSVEEKPSIKGKIEKIKADMLSKNEDKASTKDDIEKD